MESLHNFSLEQFKQAQTKMISTSESSYRGFFNRDLTYKTKAYTEKEVCDIINTGDATARRRLSRDFFYRDGFYKQIILYYATLLKYTGVLIPNVAPGQSITTKKISKRYYGAVSYMDKMNLKVLLTNCSIKVLRDGAYYGIVQRADKEAFSVIDLNPEFACTRFKDEFGNDLIEFDLRYFNSILDKKDREAALEVYPDFIKEAYDQYNKGKRKNPWIFIPAELGICFTLFDGSPYFLATIPATLQYDKAIETEQERDLEEIRKIIVQKIPHLNDGRLLFEPDEAAEMHSGAVSMMKTNPNVSVLTTYADVDAIVSKTASDTNNTSLERMLKNIYARAGVSDQLFTSTGSSTLETSLKTDIALIMYLANKYAIFVTNIINSVYGNRSINFKYIILPVGYQNEISFVDSTLKMATSGYSQLLPAIAMGINQQDIINVKDLENNLLKLETKFRPLQTSYTQSSDADSDNNGRPTKTQEEKSERTIENEESKDRETEVVNNE